MGSEDLSLDCQKRTEDNNRQDALRAHDMLREHIMKTNEIAATSANQALRTALLINGGAAVSMLAFIGGLVANGKVLLGSQLALIARPLVWFAIGVATAGLSTAFAYFTNYANASAALEMKQLWEHPWLEETDKSKKWRIFHYIFLIVSISSGFSSLVLFLIGIYSVLNGVISLGI